MHFTIIGPKVQTYWQIISYKAHTYLHEKYLDITMTS